MPAFKLTAFGGIAPKLSPELLPDRNSQIAYNVKLDSGDLVPFKEPVRAAYSGVHEEVKKLYALRHPDDGHLVWLAWPEEVDVVMSEQDITGDQRFYYTGDGSPKVSNFRLATWDNTAPYPNRYYDLGLPIPPDDVRMTATAGARPKATITKIVRDSASVCTATTSTPHKFRTGNVISVTGCPVSTSSAATFNITNSDCTVLDDYTFTYYNAGEENTLESSDDSISVELAGGPIVRHYVFTWYSPWDEESMPSEPTDHIYVREGQTVTLTDIPTEPPDDTHYVRGIKLYRTIASTGNAAYMYITTLWYPAQVDMYFRQDNKLYVTMVDPHYCIEGDYIAIKAADADSVLNTTGIRIDEIIDEFTFVLDVSGDDFDDVIASSDTKLYHDATTMLEQDIDPADRFYWGYSSYDFTDDFDVNELTTSLDSLDNEPPPDDLQGLTFFTEGVYCGFRKNQVFFSKKDHPEAWPNEYAITLDANVVGLCVCGVYLVILTDSYPFIVSGSNQATLSTYKIDNPYPCLAKRSIVQMGTGVMYATRGGLALYHPNSGMAMGTKDVHSYDTWTAEVDPHTISACFYQDRYLAAHSDGAFYFVGDIKTQGQQSSATLVNLDLELTAAWVDQQTGILYYVKDTSGYIYKYDAPTSPNMPIEWKSKVVTQKDPLNFGAARIIADYESEEQRQAIIEWNQQVTEYNQLYWQNAVDLSPVNGPLQYNNDDAVIANMFGGFNSASINGDNITLLQRQELSQFPVTFRLWKDKELIFERTVTDNGIFRLPTGFRTDTYEFAVNSEIRIRAIHMGSTPYGLKQA